MEPCTTLVNWATGLVFTRMQNIQITRLQVTNRVQIYFAHSRNHFDDLHRLVVLQLAVE